MTHTTNALPRPTAATAIEPPDQSAAVRRFFAAWAADDQEALAALVDPAGVIEAIPGLLYARDVYHGRSGVAEAVREIDARWHHFEMCVKDARPGDGQVHALLHVACEKHGMSWDADIAVVCALRDGLIVSVADDHAY